MDARLARETAKRFPMVVSVRVKEALAAIDKIAGQLTFAARAAAGLAIVTAILALASAVASGQRARLHDAVVLKTLGATRGWLAVAYGLEFGLVGLVASLIALAAGAAAAYAMVTLLMKIDFSFPARRRRRDDAGDARRHHRAGPRRHMARALSPAGAGAAGIMILTPPDRGRKSPACPR